MSALTISDACRTSYPSATAFLPRRLLEHFRLRCSAGLQACFKNVEGLALSAEAGLKAMPFGNSLT
jgi:hypothetical protein